jgi:hypothetical protein
MRPSEKTMTIASHVRQIEALKTAQAICERQTEDEFA